MVGKWAPATAAYRGPHAAQRTVIVRGRGGGRATITYRGTLGGGAATSVLYEKFTDDGATFVNGAMSGSSGVQGVGEKRVWTLWADVSISGRHTGKLLMGLTIDNAAKPLPAMTGRMSAVYDGKTAPPLPALGPCYSAQPRPMPLHLELKRIGSEIRATVTADIYGDIRPVMNATLRWGRGTVKTNAIGQATLSAEMHTPGEIVASAGDTFLPARAAPL